MIFESASKDIYFLMAEPYDHSEPMWWGYGLDAAHEEAVKHLGDRLDCISMWRLGEDNKIVLTRTYHYKPDWKDQPERRYAVGADGREVVWEP